MILGLLACTEPLPLEQVPAQVDSDTSHADTGPTPTASVPAWDTRYAYAGDQVALPPVPFQVRNQHDELRTQDWLAGHWTVVWFFRDAGTST